ncbi:MAG: hypothetical protein K6E32_06035, partial [Lachnospiraceae bacterium]|nr:hypothetical protein [Lachnospiraceae bacterium]
MIWIYMLLTVFPLGYLGLYGLISDKKQINRLIPEDFVMFGLMAVTVYAQFFSLFAGVGLAANIILLAASLAAAVFGFKSFKVSFSERLSIKPVLILVLLVSALIMAFGASRGYMHYDSDLYHAQSIHWIEDYGVVKGLGNL